MTMIERFFDEKDLTPRTYTIEHDGLSHIISSDTVIELIHTAPSNEQEKIASILRQIDYRNGDVHHFLEHLATGYISQGAA